MAPLPFRRLAAEFGASFLFGLILVEVKLSVFARLRIS